MGNICCSPSERGVAKGHTKVPLLTPSRSPDPTHTATTGMGSRQTTTDELRRPHVSASRIRRTASAQETTAVSMLVRRDRFALRSAQLKEAQQRLPASAKYLAWHLIYDSDRHGGLSPSILQNRCLQCIRDATGILRAGSAAPPDADDSDAPSVLLPGASKKGSRAGPTTTSAGSAANTAASARASSSPPPSSTSRRHQRRCVVLMETAYTVAWHAPMTTSHATTPPAASSAPPLFRLGFGLYLDKLPALNSTLVTLKPETLLLFTFLMPQARQAPVRSVPRPALSNAVTRVSSPLGGLYEELDDDARPSSAVCVPTATASLSVVRVPDRMAANAMTIAAPLPLDGARPSSREPSSRSSPVSLEDVNVTAHPRDSDGDGDGDVRRTSETTYTSDASSSCSSEGSHESVFSAHERVVVLRAHFRVGRALARCRTSSLMRGRSTPLSSSAGTTITSSPPPSSARAEWPAVEPPAQASPLAAAHPPPAPSSAPQTSTRCGVPMPVFSPLRRSSHNHVTCSSFGVSACTSVEESAIPVPLLSDEPVPLLSERAQSFLSDVTLSASFSRAPEASTYLVVSPTSTALDSPATASRRLSAGGSWRDHGAAGRVVLHERATSMFPTPPSTTTNTQSLGMDGSAADAFSPFSATNGATPLYDEFPDDGNDPWADSPLLRLRCFPSAAAATGDGKKSCPNHNMHVKSSDGDSSISASAHASHKSRGAVTTIDQAFLCWREDGSLCLWTDEKSSAHASRKKTRKGELACLARVPDVCLSSDLQEITLNLSAALFAGSAEASTPSSSASSSAGPSPLNTPLKRLLPDMDTNTRLTSASSGKSQGYLYTPMTAHHVEDSAAPCTPVAKKGKHTATAHKASRPSSAHASATTRSTGTDCVSFRITQVQLCTVGQW